MMLDGLADTVLPDLGVSAMFLFALLLALGLVLRRVRRLRAGRGSRRILVDGSNVMYWDGKSPKIETVAKLVLALRDMGFEPGVVFDANAGYLIAGKFKNDAGLARMIGLSRVDVMVVAKGTQADPFLLQAARDYGCSIVTNDRFRDWVTEFPEIQNPGHLVTGGYSRGRITVALDAAS